MWACKKWILVWIATPTRTSEAVQGVSTQAGFFSKSAQKPNPPARPNKGVTKWNYTSKNHT